MNLSGIGQSLSTDPAQYTFHARNKVLFGEFDQFDYSRWTVYQHSLVSLFAWGWFSMFGVSLTNGATVGILLSLGALLLLILGVARHHRPWVTATIAFCYVINLTLLTYGRLSYLEHGMLFLVAGAFCVYSYWGKRTIGVAIAGGLVAAAMLTGKLFGALMLPALILAIFFSGDSNRWKLILSAIAGFVIVTPLLLLALYGTDFSASISYFSEQSYGLRGFPDGLKSPWAFVEHLATYSFNNHLFYITPDLLLFLVVGMVLPIMFKLKWDKLTPVSLFAISWIAVVIVGLSPLNYSPIRYALLLIPAIILLCFTIFDSTQNIQSRFGSKLNRWQLALMTGAFWVFLIHLINNTLYFNIFPKPVRLITWGTLILAIGLTWLAKQLLKQNIKPRTSKRIWIIAIIFVLIASGVTNGFRIRRFHILESNYNIIEANADLAAILNPGAVVSGPYGPALTIDNNLQSFIHLFQVAKINKQLFVNNPVTHLAMDISNYTEAIKQYPKLKNLQRVATYWIRDMEVGVYRISNLFGNPQANKYQMSKYEQATSFYHAKQYDSALTLVADVYQAHPESKSAGLLYGAMLFETRKMQVGYNTMVSLADKFPTDFFVQLQCGRFLQMLAYRSRNQSMMNTAQKYYARAVKVNRYRGAYAHNLWNQTAKQMEESAKSQ